jgi:hypothetical protein
MSCGDSMKLNEQKHITKDGIVKNNPRNKKGFSTIINMNMWSDNTIGEVHDYFVKVINKFPKNLNEIYPAENVLLYTEDGGYREADTALFITDTKGRKNKPITTSGVMNFSFSYNVSGYFRNKNEFKKAIQSAFNIAQKYGIATDDIDDIEIMGLD